MKRFLLSFCCLLFASTSLARSVSDNSVLDGDDSLILIKLSSSETTNFPTNYLTLSLVRWEEDKISTSLAEYYSIPTSGNYVLIKQSIAGTFYPYNLEANERSAHGRKMIFGKTLKGSLVEGGKAQYRYHLVSGKINYIGDVTVESDSSSQQRLIINDDIETATQFVQNHFPTLFEQYGVVNALMIENNDVAED